jgi:hypothetical protein
MWLVGLVALAVTWWQLGATLRHRRRPVPLRWVLLTGALWAMPLLLAPPMGSRDVYAYACQGAVWLDGPGPYAVGPAVGDCPWVLAVSPLWRNSTTPYGPLAIALAGAVVALARMVTASTQGQLLVAIGLFRAVALGGGLLIARYVPRLARVCGVDPVTATWLALLSPLFALHVASGAHNDALLAGLVVAALALAATTGPAAVGTRPAALIGAGAVLGLAAAVKVTAIVALPFVVLLAAINIPLIRDPARPHVGDLPGVRPDYRDLGRTGAAVVGGVVLAFAGVTLAAGLNLGWIGALRDTSKLMEWTSLPTGLGMAAGYALRLVGLPEAYQTAVAVGRVLGIVTLAVASLALVVRGWRCTAEPPVSARRAVVIACGAAFAALALLSPVFYPWYAVTGLAVLAAGTEPARWQRALGVLVVGLSFLVLPNGLGVASRTKLPGALLDVAIVAALVVVAARYAVRQRAVPTGPAQKHLS